MHITMPLWEWRTFGTAFGGAEARVLEVARSGERVNERYIVRPSSDANVRIHEGLLDVKLCLRLDDHGLEQWWPTVQGTFPLDATEVREVYRAWNRRAPAGLAPTYDEGAFRALCAHDPDVVTVEVAKTRHLTSFEDCQSEWAALSMNGTTTCTIAVLGETPQAVWSTIHTLGLDGRENVSYVKALKRMFAAEHV